MFIIRSASCSSSSPGAPFCDPGLGACSESSPEPAPIIAPADARRTSLASSAAGLIGSIAERDFHGLRADWLTTYVPNVLKVTGADMQRLAGRSLPLGKMTLVVVGDLAKVEPQLKALPELQGMNFQRVTPF